MIGMLDEMGEGVMVDGVVTTADVAARGTHPQMNPLRTHGEAVDAPGT